MKMEAVRRRARERVRRERRVTYALKVLLLIALSLLLIGAVCDFLGRVAATGLLLVGAIVVAYLIHPLVEWFGRKIPRVAAIMVVYVMIALIGTLVTLIVVPRLSNDAQRLIQSFPDLIARMQGEILNPTLPLLRHIPLADREYVANLPAQIGALIQNYGFATAERTLQVLLSAVSMIATFIVVPVLAAYILLDIHKIQRSMISLTPPRHRRKAIELMNDLDKVAGGFIRGQIIDGTIVGAMIGTMLWIMNVPYALLIGVLGGVLNFIPYAGAIVSFVPAVILSLLYNGPINALEVTVLFGVIHQVDGNLIAPRVLKASVGLSPVWIILAILGGSELFGVAGTFLSVPVAAMLRVLMFHFVPIHEVSVPKPAVVEAEGKA